jgi:hypothetical protein
MFLFLYKFNYSSFAFQNFVLKKGDEVEVHWKLHMII